ncbi:putative TIM-barrel fold metal-dependent hydrolase [Kitasatospora sp. MAA19]|uniref:amidohydrolase family protein n=1 Tax=Kitasatospora sp. MAA19 TaxID=3035090 RepID=UPI00247432D2|nr:amidohydrolase family protein [Kitasatospora sp. MAA19]MDH6709473.1 putative TIM-barrel fold metal-dependent hydrolase [Kitasatospora sp. MAA19]
MHPSQLPGPAVPGVPAYVADYLLDTTRAVVNLVRHRVLTRHPGLRVILAHGGGFLPYASHRVAHAPNVWGDRTLDQVLAELRRFHFDTALSSSPAGLPSLLAFADPMNIHYGSDWPFATDDIDYFLAGLESHPLDDTTRAAIDRTNSARLFAGAAFLESGRSE